MKPLYSINNQLINVIKFCICLVFVVSYSNSFAQRLTSFSDDPTLYPQELERVVKDHIKKDEEDLMGRFQVFWVSDTLSADTKSDIIDISNKLLAKTAVSARHFVNLSKILLLYSQSDKVHNELSTWLLGLKDYAESREVSISQIIRFTENSLALFTENTIVINPAFRWKGSNDNYTLVYDQKLTIRFQDLNLICYNDNDSITIVSTQGQYIPIENKWVGKGGTVTWIRSKFPTNEIFATLSNYTIDLTRNEYEADSVLFTNTDYFTKPSLGRLKDRLVRTTNPDRIQYPEFHTYDQRHFIRNLFENVDFDGGYYMMGSQFIGSGTRENPAVIEISKDNEEFLRVESQSYIFRRQTIISDYARVRFRLAEDSLFHTGLHFSYNDNNRLVAIAPTDFLTTRSPILSSYHNFSINFGQIRWNLDSDEMLFGAPVGTSLGRAYFESNNFFNERDFDDIMGRDERHPLFAIANFTLQEETRVFNVEAFSRYIRKPLEEARIAVMRLAMQGYLFYEFETGTVQALPKLFDAIQARGGFIDYDVIRFNSTAEGVPNAILNLNSFEMFIRGVDNISVSDSQNVFLYPARQQLILKKNRNFAFDGRVRAGLFTFYGEGFNFDYETFSLQLASIDSLNLDYQTRDYDMYGRRVLESVTSSLENITGEILIDESNNKSGLVMNEKYPIFKSTQDSYVYYDDKSIHNGVYNRENFFFQVYPFTFYSINNFELSDMNFTGILYSADIFSPIEDTLVLRPDNSLGFRRKTPPDGFAVYQGRGKFYDRMDLSNTGLRGLGEVTYITSSTKSNDIYFFPDSMRTRTQDFSIARQDAGIQYPEVIGKEHLVKWFPYDEQLFAFRGRRPFEIFQNQASLAGNLVLEPLGLVGDGLMDMKKARLRSDEYTFNAIDFSTPKASVEFDVVNTEEVAFASNEVKAFVDFEAQQGIFQKIDDRIFADLPPMMYHSHLDEFTWGIKQNELTIHSPSRIEDIGSYDFYVPNMVDRDTIPSGALFYSLHAEEDSLYFFSQLSKYNLAQPGIKADSVKHLVIADAIINPQNQKIEVDAKKRVLPLRESKILANYSQKYHKIYDANITIPSRKRYYAKGTIDYIDEEGSKQPIILEDIAVNRLGNTFASTIVTQPDSFRLSPHFRFFGDIDLIATEKHWTFKGGAQPIHDCTQIRSSNVQFEAKLNPKDIYIPVPSRARNINQAHLVSGSVVTVDSIHLYPSFLSGRKEHSDRTLLAAEGYLHFNKNRNRFQIGSIEKINNPDTTGNLISLARDFCMLFSEGTVNLPVNLGQIKHYSSGLLTHILADSILNMNMVLSLDFHFNQASLEAMATEILETEGLASTDLNRNIYHKYIFEKTSPAEANTAINQIKLFGAPTQIPRELQSTITFTDIQMKWDHKNTSFVSQGRLGIGNIGNEQVNKRVNGFVEIYKRNTGDRITMYIELAPDKYYVFYYVRGSMQVSSHNPLFTDPINDMRSRERRVRVRGGEIPFNFVVGTRRELERAQQRYREILGIDQEPESEGNEDTEKEKAIEPDEEIDAKTEETDTIEAEVDDGETVIEDAEENGVSQDEQDDNEQID